MASRVFSYKLESCPTGSLPVRARRIRAVICFQSAMCWHAIVAAEARYSQRRPGILGKRFFGPGMDSLLTAGEAVRILQVALLETFMARSREIVAAILTSGLLM